MSWRWPRVAIKCNRPSGLSPDKVREAPARRSLRYGIALMAICVSGPLHAQVFDCDSYARAYADAHVSGDPTDLHIVDQAMEGAVAGGAWRGPRGARRGAVAGGALGVLDTLGNNPAGWRGLYDLAFRLCHNSQSPATHRPSTLGDPSYRPALPPRRAAEPPVPAFPVAPRKPEN
jgi:hypothetical protein